MAQLQLMQQPAPGSPLSTCPGLVLPSIAQLLADSDAPPPSAAASLPAEEPSSGEPALFSLIDGTAPDGLFRVIKARADALLPLEAQEVAPGEAARRDRAATARKALSQRGSKPTSAFRGVTHHLRTGRWEAHIWMQGKQMYLGGFDSEREAALAYDLAAVKFRGPGAQLNFSMRNYAAELRLRDHVDGDELVAVMRRQSRGPPVTSSSFKGVTRHLKGK